MQTQVRNTTYTPELDLLNAASSRKYNKEEHIMSMKNLFGKTDEEKAPACGTACGAGDKPAEKPAACGTACGAGDKPAEKPAACGTACGTGDKK